MKISRKVKKITMSYRNLIPPQRKLFKPRTRKLSPWKLKFLKISSKMLKSTPNFLKTSKKNWILTWNKSRTFKNKMEPWQTITKPKLMTWNERTGGCLRCNSELRKHLSHKFRTNNNFHKDLSRSFKIKSLRLHRPYSNSKRMVRPQIKKLLHSLRKTYI